MGWRSLPGAGLTRRRSATPCPAGSRCISRSANFNGDGNADVIVTNGTTALSEYLGSASGQFHLQTTVHRATSIISIAAADVNHDGKMDLIFNSVDSKLHVWFGDGAGGFTVGPGTVMAASGAISIGDFDGDGKVDVVSQLNAFGNTIQVFYGDGAGHFAAASSFSDDAVYNTYDLNGDGRTDLVGDPFDFSLNGSTYYKVVRVLSGNANRTFTTRNIALANCTVGVYHRRLRISMETAGQSVQVRGLER